MKRNQQINIKLSSHELEIVDRAAAAAKKSRSEYIRQHLTDPSGGDIAKIIRATIRGEMRKSR